MPQGQRPPGARSGAQHRGAGGGGQTWHQGIGLCFGQPRDESRSPPPCCPRLSSLRAASTALVRE